MPSAMKTTPAKNPHLTAAQDGRLDQERDADHEERDRQDAVHAAAWHHPVGCVPTITRQSAFRST